MPINPIVLQRRHTELGRIRLGDKGSKGQPQKLNRFRFTSAHEGYVRDLATLYGGEARKWVNGNRDEWEVYSEASVIPVIVVKGGLSQWMETWSGGGCIHRCDGVTNEFTHEDCDPDDADHLKAKPTTRFSVMLPELEAIGVWRTETHGWNAGAELPPMVELAMHLGELVPARLMLADRVSIKDGKTNRFVVPTLDLGISAARLAAVVSGHAQPPAITTGDTPAAIESAPKYEFIEELADCESPDDVRALWHTIKDAGLMNEAVAAMLSTRAEELKPVAPQPDPLTAGPSQSAVDMAWQALVTYAGTLGKTMTQIETGLVEFFGQPVAELTAEQLVDYRQILEDAA